MQLVKKLGACEQMQVIRQIVVISLKFRMIRIKCRSVRMIEITLHLGVIMSGMLVKPRREKANGQMRDDQRAGNQAAALF